jgi:arylsulfatase A-like enzyme
MNIFSPKRSSMLLVVCLMSLFSVMLTATTVSASALPAKPNVLLIAVDDLNDWVGFTGGHPDTLTPNLDALAARGTVFNQAYAQFPLCGPSRASIFSGLLPSQLNMYSHPSDNDVAKTAQQNGTPLLHTYFRQHGYKTMAVGKILHRHVPKGSVDLSGGRGGWDKMPDGKEVNFFSTDTSTDWGPYPGPEDEMSDPKAADWAIKRLQEKHEKPFMLMTGFIRPHVPWHVPQKYYDTFSPASALTLPPYKSDDLADISPYARKTNTIKHMPKTKIAIKENYWHDIIQSYLASVNFADYHIGRVLKALEKSPYADNTVIVLFSDHGYLLGEKGTFQKHALWGRANKAPLIFVGPNVPAGESRDQPVGLIDIYPTLLDLVGLPAIPVHQGHNLQPLLANAQQQWDHPVITQYKKGYKKTAGSQYTGQAIQSGNWRYSLYGDGSEELYNHAEDPNEWHNLANDQGIAKLHRARIEQLKAQLPKDF